jgi:hypothetical protein
MSLELVDSNTKKVIPFAKTGQGAPAPIITSQYNTGRGDFVAYSFAGWDGTAAAVFVGGGVMEATDNLSYASGDYALSVYPPAPIKALPAGTEVTVIIIQKGGFSNGFQSAKYVA